MLHLDSKYVNGFIYFHPGPDSLIYSIFWDGLCLLYAIFVLLEYIA